MGRPAQPVAERFWAKIDKSGACWLWTGSASCGYGQFRLGPDNDCRMIKPHVYAYTENHGPPVNLVLHHCDTPLCVKPAHLYDGTHQDNANDKMARGRHRASVGPNNGACWQRRYGDCIMDVKMVVDFIKAREQARAVHDSGGGKARDPIIAKFRFCNVLRNDDRVTKFILEWAQRYHTDPDLWFSFVVARLFNNPESLAEIARYVLPFKPAGMGTTLEKRRDDGVKVFNAAYIVSTNGRAMDKIAYVIIHVLQPLWAARKALRPQKGEPLASWHARLQGHQGMGSFMAAQVVADLKYATGPLAEAADFATFAASGPGSRRGLNRVLGNPVDAPWKELVWRGALTALRSAVLPKVAGIPHIAGITAQNLQNCLCELDKYQRAKLGEGTPKQLYAPWKSHPLEI